MEKKRSAFQPLVAGLPLIHNFVSTKLPTHSAGAVLFINPGFGSYAACFFGVHGDGELAFPVKLLAALRHGDVLLHGTGYALDDIAGVGSDAAGDDPFVDILHRWQSEVFAGGDVTEEVGTGCSSQCASKACLKPRSYNYVTQDITKQARERTSWMREFVVNAALV